MPAARRRLRAMGWLENCSARAAASSTRLSSAPGAGSTRATSKTPWVRVPVLSNTTVRVLARASR